MTGADAIATAAGLSPDSPVTALRQQRADFVRYGQGSYDALIAPADPAGVSLIERAACALRVAAVEHDAALIASYGQRLAEVGADAATLAAAEQGALTGISPRLAAILHHVARITTAPATATKLDLQGLLAVGLTPRDVVIITQIVAFVSYQIRVVAGLRLLGQEHST